jgi:hypothetical protein
MYFLKKWTAFREFSECVPEGGFALENTISSGEEPDDYALKCCIKRRTSGLGRKKSTEVPTPRKKDLNESR